MVASERAMKTESETGVKSDTPFCSQLPIEKTNSECTVCLDESRSWFFSIQVQLFYRC